MFIFKVKIEIGSEFIWTTRIFWLQSKAKARTSACFDLCRSTGFPPRSAASQKPQFHHDAVMKRQKNKKTKKRLWNFTPQVGSNQSIREELEDRVTPENTPRAHVLHTHMWVLTWDRHVPDGRLPPDSRSSKQVIFPLHAFITPPTPHSVIYLL